MIAGDTAFATIGEITGGVISGEVPALARVECVLSRIEALDPQVHAYLRVDAVGARRQAQAIDQAVAAGEPVGPLAGVPIGIKDLIVTRDLETTAASRMLEGWIPPYDATCVARLRNAGAIIIGKHNMDEFAMGSSTEFSAYGPTRNPWSLAHVPGGSSGGSAAAVALDLCTASLGTDTGGSIRQPAALCGVVGIKPTYGRVSRWGVIAFASSLDQVGPITRTVEDAARVLEVIAGPDPHDSTSTAADVPAWCAATRKDARGLRVGVPEEIASAHVDPAVRAAFGVALDRLRELGVEVVSVSLPKTAHAVAAYYLIAPAEASSNLARYDGIRYGQRVQDPSSTLTEVYERSRGQGFGPEVKRRIMLGTYALRAGYYEDYYVKAQRVRRLIKDAYERAFDEVDAIVTPTTPAPAFPLGTRETPVAMYLSDMFTLSCNLAGLPGISVPCGFSEAGLPIGLQFIGRALDESTLFQLAATFERAAGAPQLPPMARGATS